MIAIYRCSDRVTGIDLKFCRQTIRMISVYMPYSGYDRSHRIGYLESTYDQLHGLLYEVKRLHSQVVVGGDFNTTLANHRRADLMIDLVHAFDLAIGDDPLVNANASSWSHSHPLYGKRQIDFILVSRNIIVDECHASHILDLGSDHRAVLAKIHLPKRRKRWMKPTVKRGWRPDASYIIKLNAKLDDNQDLTLETLGMLLVHCASKCKMPDSAPSCCKPWQDAEVRRLVADRRDAVAASAALNYRS